jgi:uncharacterized protein DUF6788
MPIIHSRTPKSAMSIQERNKRSRLSKLISGRGLLRGTLSTRAITCGKATCKCTRGEKHMYLYLIVSDEGKPTQILIPRSREEEVKRWVWQYQRVQELLEEISDSYRSQIKAKKE